MILLPIPKEVEYKEGAYILSEKMNVSCSSERVINYLSDFIVAQNNGEISFKLNGELENEEYTLEISESLINIEGGSEEALLWKLWLVKDLQKI